MAKKKILVVTQHFWPETFRINDICDYLVENDCEVEVLCGLPNYPKGKLFDGYSFFRKRKQIHNGTTIYRAPEITRGNNSNMRVFLNYLSFPFFSLFHIPRMVFTHYDKIFLYQTSPVMMSVSGVILGKLKRTETTMYVLDLWPENLYSVLPVKNNLLRKVIEKVSHWHYKNADKLIVLSEKMKERVIETTGKSDEKVIILPQSCEKLYEQDIDDPSLKKQFNKGFNAVFTGSITPAQSFETVVDTASILKKKGITDINWIIVGDGMALNHVKQLVKEAGLSNSFHFEGQRPVADMPRYSGVADVLFGCLVRSEFLEATIPAKVMSYIASGKPMVLSMDGEVQQLINSTIKCGLVGPTEDTAALAANIEKIYKLSNKERAAMGKRARDYHFKHLERSIVMSKLLAFISR